jgi:hypothetical protein
MSLFPVFFLIALGTSIGYAGGRIHQWYRTALERDRAWRDGYDQGTDTLFKAAAKLLRRKPGEHTGEIPIPVRPVEATVTDISEAPSAGRHSVEIRNEITRRLTPLPNEQVG